MYLRLNSVSGCVISYINFPLLSIPGENGDKGRSGNMIKF